MIVFLISNLQNFLRVCFYNLLILINHIYLFELDFLKIINDAFIIPFFYLFLVKVVKDYLILKIYLFRMYDRT